jgi:hypothetical protein
LGRNEISTAAQPQSAPASRWKRTLPGLLISLVALVVLFRVIKPREILEVLQQADGWLVAIGMLITLPWLVLRGKVWGTLLQGQASFRDVFWTLNEGYLLNNLLPFRLGEIGRAYLLGRKARLNFWQVFPSVVLERMFDLILAAGLLVLTLPLIDRANWGEQTAAEAGRANLLAVGVGLLVALGFLAIYLLARYQGRVTAWLERWSQHKPWLQKLLGRRLETFFSGLQVLKEGRLFLRALAWMLINWACSVLLYLIFLRAFFPQATLLWAIFVLAFGSFGIAAPSSPGGVGVFEWAHIGALAILLQAKPSAEMGAFALVLHLSNYIITGLLGGYALLREGETLSNLYNRLGRLKEKG